MERRTNNMDLARLTDGDELARLPSERVITILHARKRKILEAARNNRTIQEVIFAQRENIAAFFRQHGGRMHENTAGMFENLQKPEDIIPFIPPPKTEIVKKGLPEEGVNEGRHTRAGYFVLGKELTEKQIKMIQEQRGTATRKTGFPMHNRWRSIFLERDRDHTLNSEYKRYGRAIYINETRTPELLLQLEILCNLNPDIIGHLFFIEFSETGKVIVIPFTSIVTIENPGFIKDMTKITKAKELALRISVMREYEPQEGDVHIGTISAVGEFGIIVQITPDIEVYISANGGQTEMHKVGSKITIILERPDWSRHLSGRFKRSRMEGFTARELKDWELPFEKRPVFSKELYEAWEQFTTGNFTPAQSGPSTEDELESGYQGLELTQS